MSGGGARARRRIAASAALARRLAIPQSRAERFRARRAGRRVIGAPDFAELRRWPVWPGLEAEAQTRIWALTALLAGRDTLAREIDGARLRRYAEAVGAPLLEQALALPAGGDRVLAPAEGLAAHGRTLAEAALPPLLAERLSHPLHHDAGAAGFVAQAEALLGEGSR